MDARYYKDDIHLGNTKRYHVKHYLASIRVLL